MTQDTQAYFFVITSTTCFSGASLLFAEISRKVSPLWMNAFKALVAWLCFAAVIVVGSGWTPVTPLIFAALLASGILGLGIGDVFLLSAYARMGAARTMILYGFQPLFIGVAASLFFGQAITWVSATAVAFFIGCLFVFSLEKFRQDGHWEIFGLVAALLGVLLDNGGVILTRWSFDQVPALSSFQANSIRCTGALMVFMVFGAFRQVKLAAGWKSLSPRNRFLAVFASALGTFVSLSLYLTGVKIGQLASISAIAAVGPILTSAMECIYLRKWPSSYLLVALGLFLAGFGILTLI